MVLSFGRWAFWLMTEVLPSWLCSRVLSRADSEGFHVRSALFPTLAQHGFPVATL